MSGRHTAPLALPRQDPHGYIRLGRTLARFGILCGCLVLVATISLILVRIGANT